MAHLERKSKRWKECTERRNFYKAKLYVGRKEVKLQQQRLQRGQSCHRAPRGQGNRKDQRGVYFVISLSDFGTVITAS